MIDESELIEKARRGDDEAFGRLVLRYREAVRHLLHRLLGPDELDDREQEVFVAAWCGIRRFRNDAPFGTWLRRIAVHHAARRLRHRRARPRSLVEEPGDGNEPSRKLFEAERARRVRDAVESLPPKLRVTFTLRFVEGLSGEEVATLLEVPAATVRSRLHAARRTLSAHLGEEIEE